MNDLGARDCEVSAGILSIVIGRSLSVDTKPAYAGQPSQTLQQPYDYKEPEKNSRRSFPFESASAQDITDKFVCLNKNYHGIAICFLLPQQQVQHACQLRNTAENPTSD